MAQPYQEDYDSGVAGTWSAIGGEQRSVPFIASADVTPGLACSFDADGKVTNAGSASLAFAGIGLVDSVATQRENNVIADGESISVADRGSVWVNLTGAEASAVGGAVYRVLATGAITATASEGVVIPNARFESATSSGALADVRLG